MDESELARAVHYSNGRDAGYEAGLRRALELAKKSQILTITGSEHIESTGDYNGQYVPLAELRTAIKNELEEDRENV